MTVLFTPDFRAIRPTTTMDPFHRYYCYRQDDSAGDYDIFTPNASIAFKQLEELPQNVQHGAREVEEEDGVVEYFQWSYGGFSQDGSTPNECSSELRDNWSRISDPANANNNRVFDNDNIPPDAKLKLIYYEPPRDAGGRAPANLDGPYNFATALQNFSEHHSLNPAFSPENGINAQSDQIRDRFVDFLSSGAGSLDPLDGLAQNTLSSIYYTIDDFGDRRTPIEPPTQEVQFRDGVADRALRAELEVLRGLQREDTITDAQSARLLAIMTEITASLYTTGWFKFLQLLTTAPIVQVPPGDIANHINSLSRTTRPGPEGGIGSSRRRRGGEREYSTFNAIVVSELPQRTIEDAAIEDVEIWVGDDDGVATYSNFPAQKPLQNLLEVYYALFGYQGDAYTYSEITDWFQTSYGSPLPPINFYNLLDTVLKIDRGDWAHEEPFLFPIINNGPVASFESYNFAPFGKNVFDYQSYRAMTGIGETPEKIEATLEFSAINPEYNYYTEAYETAIAASNVPEAVLPNMYIYSFVSDRDNTLDQDPPWNDQRGTQNSQIQNNFDRLITLDEFDATSLPGLGGEDNDEFLRYLQNYAEALATEDQGDDTGVTIEFLSDLAREYYNITTPASEMNLYDRLNSRKVVFPMYIEVGFPMGSTGLVGSLIDKSLTSTAFVDSVIKTPATADNFYMAAKGFTIDASPIPATQRVFDAYNFSETPPFVTRPRHHLVNIRSNNRIFDFDEWIRNAMTAIEAAQLGEEQQEPRPGECPGIETRMSAQAVEDLIHRTARQHMKPYSEILAQHTVISPSETIIYKLTKRKIDNEGVVGPPIQQFYFPNSTREHLVKFVDTQIKYNELYRYELFGVTVVYGSKYEMQVLDTELNPEENTRLFMTMAVTTKPNPKIVEHPIHTSAWNSVCVGGLAFPDVRADDRPPPPPQILLAPFKQNYRQILLALQPSNEVFIQKRAIEWILLNEQSDWEETFRSSILFQKQFKNYGLVSPKLEFASESGAEIKRMEIYRSREVEENATNQRDFYRLTFNGKLHKTLDISGDPSLPEAERAVAFDCIDNLEPNVKYYYTARSIDVHGKASNPTSVYQVELVYDRGTYYPYIDLYRPKYKSRKQPTRRMSRFLEIKAAPIQTAVKNTFDATSKLVSSEKGFLGFSGHAVENNLFLVRLTSRDTGRKIQFNLAFKKSETTGET